MLNARSTIRDTSVFTSSVIVSTAISGIVGLAIARLLDPAGYGLFQSMQVLWQYGVYVTLGTPLAMQQDIARLASTGRSAEVQATANATFSFALVTSLLLAATLLTMAALRSWPFPVLLTAGITAFLLVRQLYGLSLAALTANRQFGVAGRGDIAAALLNLLLTVLLTRRSGIQGLLLAQVGWAGCGTLLLLAMGGRGFRWQWNSRLLVGQMRRGAQFTINSLFQVTTSNVGRLMVLWSAGTVALGYYGIATLALSYVGIIGSAFSRALLPSIVGTFEQRQAPEDLRSFIIAGSIVLGALLPVITGGVALLIPALVGWLLPKYLPGVAAAQILVLASALALLRSSAEIFFVALNRLHHTFAVQAAAIAAALLVALAGRAAGRPLEGAAAGAALAFGMISGGLLTLAYRYYDHSLRGLLRFLAATHLPVCYCGAVLLVMTRLLVSDQPALGTLGRLGVSLLAYGLASVPLLWWANRYGQPLTRVLRTIGPRSGRPPA